MISINKEPELNVGILSGDKITFELYGNFKSSKDDAIFSGRFTAELVDGKIQCKCAGKEDSVKNEIIFEPEDPEIDSFMLRDVVIGLKFHWERKEKQRFKGKLKLKLFEDNIYAINIVGLEEYLISVVSSEMSAKSMLHLLKAHAVISRSWLLSQLKNSSKKSDPGKFETENEIIRWYDRGEHELFDVCADDHCQRYQGITKVISNAARQAVNETRGLVLTYNEKICDTRYSKACGGITESFENVWQPVKFDYLTSIIDYKFEPDNFNIDFTYEENAEEWIAGKPPAYCNTGDVQTLSQVLPEFDRETKDFYRWKVEYTQAELSKIIKAKSKIDFGEIIDLIPVERGYSGRLVKLKIAGSKKSLIIGKELEIRRILSESHLYSSAIFIQKENFENNVPQNFIIYGAGWGHGVGLCQIGAAVMAEKGHQFDEILLHYFSSARLKKIYK